MTTWLRYYNEYLKAKEEEEERHEMGALRVYLYRGLAASRDRVIISRVQAETTSRA